jgi:hypothetical protein
MKYVIEKYINGKFVICTLLKLWSNQGQWDGQEM